MPLARRAVWWRRPWSGALGIATGLGWRGTALDVPGLLQRAREDSGGLGDFGDEAFIEPLELLVREFAANANADMLGRAAFSLTLRRCLQNRLRLREAVRVDPAMATQPTQAPLFLVGLPRTGTTLLQGLLSQVEGLRPLLNWETNVAAQSPALASEREREVQRDLAGRQVAQIYRLSPATLRVHEFGALLPEECNPLLMTGFASLVYCMLFSCPAYFEHLRRSDFAGGYEWHRLHLQWLAHRQPPRTWLLKGPAHFGAMDALLRIYPDARVVYLHRNPLEAVPSAASLGAHLRMLYSPWQDPRAIGDEALRMLGEAQQAGYATRDRWPAHATPFIDVGYEDLLAHPAAAVTRILAHFGIPEGADLAPNLAAYLDQYRQHRRGAHRYSTGEFGLNADTIRQVFHREFDVLARGRGH